MAPNLSLNPDASSAALRAGTTAHIEPHPHQIDAEHAAIGGASPVDWAGGADDANTVNLLLKGMENVERHLPAVKNFAYDFERGQFVSRMTDEPIDTRVALTSYP